MTKRICAALSLTCLALLSDAPSVFAAELKKNLGNDSANTATATLLNTNVAEMALAEIRQRNFERAFEILKPAAETGQPEAQALLGQLFQSGWGSPPDYDLAFKWWSRAAEKGSTDAQWGLGLLYNDGKGVQQDDRKAAEWWRKAADRGNIKATVNLAFLYDEGRGVAIDRKEGARLFKQASEAGEPFAQMKFGLKLVAGDGIERDTVLGAAWVAISAESPRIRNSSQAVMFHEQRAKIWKNLASDERQRSEKLKAELSQQFGDKE